MHIWYVSNDSGFHNMQVSELKSPQKLYVQWAPIAFSLTFPGMLKQRCYINGEGKTDTYGNNLMGFDHSGSKSFILSPQTFSML